ncbi:MAG TPA: AAA family ATPase, partial [Steroidobacteraceae bacterium]|nr:AAA family ATPase [Steroidobacteraceae bacterium]
MHQLWWSVDAWLRLDSPDDVFYLEGAEDLDKVGTEGGLTFQIKNEIDGLSLNNQRAHEVLENFWTLSEQETGRRVDFHYVSTAPISVERDADFGGLSGLECWRAAQTSLAKAETLRIYLAGKLAAHSRLGAFLAGASACEVQQQVIQRLHWFLQQPGLEEVKQSVDDRITVRLSAKGIDLSYVKAVRDRLFGHLSDVVVRESSRERRVNLASLLRETDAATTAHVAVPASLRGQLLAALRSGHLDPGEALLRYSKLPLPAAPTPVLSRPRVVACVRSLVEGRSAVLLTGTVHKGKTTIAQLVANELCEDAWWFSVASRGGAETDRLFRALAGAIDSSAAPAVIVIDDVDLSPVAYEAYRQSLALVVSRATRSGRGI